MGGLVSKAAWIALWESNACFEPVQVPHMWPGKNIPKNPQINSFYMSNCNLICEGNTELEK